MSGPAIKIRGNPIDRAIASNNVFAHGKGDAVKQNGDKYELTRLTKSRR